MYWCPDVTQTVPIIETTVETSVLSKTRQLDGPYMYAVGGLDASYTVVSSVERYDVRNDQCMGGYGEHEQYALWVRCVYVRWAYVCSGRERFLPDCVICRALRRRTRPVGGCG
jgi:hypothetical protein